MSSEGSLTVMDGFTLETVARFSPGNVETEGRIHSAIFCSGLGSFCMCTENGKLHFLHLVKKNELTDEVDAAGASQASDTEKHVKGNQDLITSKICYLPCILEAVVRRADSAVLWIVICSFVEKMPEKQ